MTVSIDRDGDIAVVTVDNPPVKAQAMGLVDKVITGGLRWTLPAMP
jgi:hypothetical protein